MTYSVFCDRVAMRWSADGENAHETRLHLLGMADMLHDFLSKYKDELTLLCVHKEALRSGRPATAQNCQSGVTTFLDQLIRTLSLEHPAHGRLLTDKCVEASVNAEMAESATRHGKALQLQGISAEQLVHSYGDLCQTIADLAIERNTAFEVHEFRTMNRCLDNAIAGAITEFNYQRDFITAAQYVNEEKKRLGCFVHELRNLLSTTSLAFLAAKTGRLSLTGTTGNILERSISGLGRLIDDSVGDVKVSAQQKTALKSFSLADLVAEAAGAAKLSADLKGLAFKSYPVDGELSVCGKRELLLSALANLLQNAFKFTAARSEVSLRAYAAGDRILIDIQDHCGGLAPGVEDAMFKPFFQGSSDRSGLGLGLTISKQAVEANGGVLSVRDIAGVGCIFTMNLPRHALPT